MGYEAACCKGKSVYSHTVLCSNLVCPFLLHSYLISLNFVFIICKMGLIGRSKLINVSGTR